jgi:MFS transporter, ACS family, tartrate transporter
MALIADRADLSAVANRTRRRITRRVMPYLMLLFVIAFIDRVNVGYAALRMKGDLAFGDDVIGFGAGVFFIGYFLLEIPGTILVEKWSARGWISRIMISWGVVAILMGFMNSRHQFYFLRFLLGAAEAGFFPGIIVYLSHWFRYEDRAKAVAMFMAAVPISNIIGAPASGLLMSLNWWGLAGWRWLFIIEGVPAILFGIVTIFYLTDRPDQAHWLTQEEKRWITGELENERQRKREKHSYRILQAMRHREVLLLATIYFLTVTATYGFNFWLPTIIKKASGASILTVSLLSALPYCAALAGMLLVGWSSDRTRERRWHAAGCMMIVGLGLLLSLVTQNHIGLAISMFSLAAVGMYGYLPSFWALPTSFLSGTAAAASIGLINSIGNLGGFAGPYVVGYVSKVTGSFSGGVLYLSISALLAATLVLSIRATKRERVR